MVSHLADRHVLSGEHESDDVHHTCIDECGIDFFQSTNLETITASGQPAVEDGIWQPEKALQSPTAWEFATHYRLFRRRLAAIMSAG